MKNLNFKTTLFLALLSLASCDLTNRYEGSDDLVMLSRSLPEFNKITASTDLVVNITQGPVQDIQITVNANLQDRLETKVNDKTLNITLKNGNYRNTTFIVDIQIPALRSLKLEDHVSGELFFGGESIDLDIRDASELEIYGKAKTLNVTLKDAGKIHGYSFISETLNAQLQDAALLEISCMNQLNATAKDAAKLNYKGNPVLNVTTKDAAKISKVN